MSFTKPLIVLALTTALTACASSPDAVSRLTKAEAIPSTALITVTTKTVGAGAAGPGFPFYKICKEVTCKPKIRSLDGIGSQSRDKRVTANEPIVVFAAFLGTNGTNRERFIGERRDNCARKLEILPKANTEYRVTLVEENKGTCSLELTEVKLDRQ